MQFELTLHSPDFRVERLKRVRIDGTRTVLISFSEDGDTANTIGLGEASAAELYRALSAALSIPSLKPNERLVRAVREARKAGQAASAATDIDDRIRLSHVSRAAERELDDALDAWDAAHVTERAA